MDNRKRILHIYVVVQEVESDVSSGKTLKLKLPLAALP